jgi:hypothetical protein
MKAEKSFLSYIQSLLKNSALSRVWWHMTIILAVGRLRQKDGEFKASLSYLVKLCPRGEKNAPLKLWNLKK